MKYIDIGANLIDPVFTGIYRGTTRHPSDFSAIINRAFAHGVDKIIITGGNYEESKQALALARTHEKLFCTVGVHPTRCDEFFADSNTIESHVANLIALIKDGMSDGKVVACGELGLDYDRLQFCSKENQMKGLLAQLDVVEATNLPLFCHNRNCGNDLLDVLTIHKDKWNALNTNGAVIHSFDGSALLAKSFTDLGLFLGINGCSLRTEESLEVVKSIPSDKLLLETDAPWCDIRPTHPGYKFVQTKLGPVKQEKKWEEGCYVKNRNEPSHIINVAEVLAGARSESVEELTEQCYANTLKLFKFA
jgi:TatD DNase family protein